MKFIIRHEIKGRIRIHLCQNHMTMRQADLLAWFLSNQPMVEEAKVYERTADAVIHLMMLLLFSPMADYIDTIFTYMYQMMWKLLSNMKPV